MPKRRNFAAPRVRSIDGPFECGCVMLTYDGGAVQSQPCSRHGATLPSAEFVPLRRSAFERFRYAQLAAR